MQTISFAWLEHIRDGEDFSGDYLEESREEERTLRDIYKKIDISRLDEFTGKSIVEECQPLIEEFYDQYFVLQERYISSGFKSQEVPQRLFEIRDKVTAAYKEYGQLEANALYRKALQVGYFGDNSRSSTTRMEWFINGKPTDTHPEKLKLVLSEANELCLTKRIEAKSFHFKTSPTT